MDYEGLGKRIKTLRRFHGLTQEELSKRVSISLSFLGHIERGSRKASIDTLVKLACALEVGTDELLQDSVPHIVGTKPVQHKDTAAKMHRTARSRALTTKLAGERVSQDQSEMEAQKSLLRSLCITLGVPLDRTLHLDEHE